MDSAGEFIYMASLLIHIKSKMLLPRDPSDVAGGDSEDPRRELVERLLEHERFKAAAQMLLEKQQIEEATWTTPGLKNFRRDIGEMGAPTLDEDREVDADTVDLVRGVSGCADQAAGAADDERRRGVGDGGADARLCEAPPDDGRSPR